MIDEKSFAIYQKWHLRNVSQVRDFNPWLSDQDLLDVLRAYAAKIGRGQHKIYGVNTHSKQEVSDLVFANLSPGFHAVALDADVVSQEVKNTVLRIYFGYRDKHRMIEEVPNLLEFFKEYTSKTEMKFLVDHEAFPRSDAVTVYITGGISNQGLFLRKIQEFGNYDKKSVFTVPLGECVSSVLELPSMGQAEGLSYGLFCARLIQHIANELSVEPDSLIAWLISEMGFWLPKEVSSLGHSLEGWISHLTNY